MKEQIERVLICEEDIQKKMAEIGAQISRDYQSKKLLLVGVLKGSVVVVADLMRQITIPCELDFMAVSSYGGGANSSGVVRILKDLNHDISGYDILIVEDILDTGFTLHYLSDLLQRRNPASLAIVTLLDKPERRKVPVQPRYVGFQIPDEFVVGYGMDYNEQYRNLPYIGVIKPQVYQE